jgi:hypothetical protein
MEYILEDAYSVLRLIRELREVASRYFPNGASQAPNPKYCYEPRYTDSWTRIYNVIMVSQTFGIEDIDVNKDNLMKRINYLRSPQIVTEWREFNSNLNFIDRTFKYASYELKAKINRLEGEEERNRLNEAFNCHVQGLNYSTIIMSVSAVENRLYKLLKFKNPEAKIDTFTLGQLIHEYTNNKENYGNFIPKKHEPLLDYCNYYRVFSVHPNKEKIKGSDSLAVLCMACSFLFDKSMKIA